MNVIALVVGELTAYLTVNKDSYKRGVQEARTELHQLAGEANRQSDATASRSGRMVTAVSTAMAQVGRNADRQGRDAGGKLSQGISQGIIRNSPLIVAGIGAALAAGAPLMMAAATGLFAGVGIVAAAQSDKVQSAWLGTWQAIRDGAVSDAAVIEPVLVRVAANVGAAFQRMRPQVQNAFAAAAPQIEVFSQGIVNLAQNALPGLVRAVQQGMPVTQGLADFLAKIGSGLGEFFDRISAHGPAAGQVFSQLGDVMANLLPLLGELLGQGAELATQVLPLLSGSLGIVLSIVESTNGALPALVAGFTALKVIQQVGGWLSTAGTGLTVFAQNMAFASYGNTAFAGTAGKLSTAASGASGALKGVGSAASAGGPLVAGLAVTFGLLMAAHQQSEERIRTWTAALNEGGSAARTAREEMAAQDTQVREATSGWQGFVTAMTPAGIGLHEMSEESAAAKAASDAYIASLTPLQAAQRESSIAQTELSRVIGEYGPQSDQARAAADRYRDAQAEVERQSGRVQQAIQGVTDAMIAQADQALAAIDSGFAYRNSVDQLEDAQAKLAETQAHVNDTNADTRTSSEDVQRAMLGLEEQTFRTAAAYGKQQADLSGLEEGSAAYNRLVQESMLASLQQLQQSAGPEMQAAIGQQIAALQAGGVAVSANTSLVNTLTGQVAGLTGQIHAVPGQKYVQIDAPTAAQVQQLQNLGYTVTHLPNGNIYVSAQTAAAEAALNYAARDRYSRVMQTVVGSSIRSTVATGGKIGDVVRGFAGGGSPMRRADGKLIGPGGPLDDLIPALTNMGEQIRVANSEWVINGAVSSRQGDRRMAALNAGMADIVLRGDRNVRGLAGGGMSTGVNPTTGSALIGARGDVHFHLNGSVDFGDRAALRKAADVLYARFVEKERESR